MRELFLVVCLASFTSLAETQSFNLQRMRTSLDTEGLNSVESGAVPQHGQWSVRLIGNVESNPLVLVRTSTRERVGTLLQDRASSWVTGSFAFAGIFQLGLEVPVTLYQWRPPGEISGVTTGPIGSLSSFGMGDVRVVPKIGLWQTRRGAPIDLSVLLPVTFPTGQAQSYRGDSGLGFFPELALAVPWKSWRWLANVAFPIRRPVEIVGVTVSEEIYAGAGAAYRFFDAQRSGLPFELGATVTSFVPRNLSSFGATEVRAQAAYWPHQDWQLHAGAGMGLTNGWGNPDWRAFAGVTYTHTPSTSKEVVPVEPIRAPSPAVAVAPEPPPSELPTPAPQPAPSPPPVLARPDILEIIFFPFNNDMHDASFNASLDRVASVLTQRPDIERVIIEGHTDNKGSDTYNQDLSARRARTVKKALVARGVSEKRFEIQGFGASRPLDSNSTVAGRARNRRVVFVIAETADVKGAP